MLTEQRIDWLEWYDRWELMMACYNPGRDARIHLLVTIPEPPDDGELRILDLGAGPGSTGLAVLRRHESAEILAVEADPVLVEMGRAVVASRELGEQVQYLHADIRDGAWWADQAGRFDLVVSATALHWLNTDHYREVCSNSYQALKPGGWFMNCDHVAAPFPELQARYNEWRRERQERAFAALGGETWEQYWAGLEAALTESRLLGIRCIEELWEGSDDGLPKPVHLDALDRAGFELSDIYWQELGEAIVGGRKPSG